MTDDEQRIEWQGLRDSMIARMQSEDASVTREEAIESIALTFWQALAGRIVPDVTYSQPVAYVDENGQLTPTLHGLFRLTKGVKLFA
jgi:hypothetical protein